MSLAGTGVELVCEFGYYSQIVERTKKIKIIRKITRGVDARTPEDGVMLSKGIN